jgi:hypothetical protein
MKRILLVSSYACHFIIGVLAAKEMAPGTGKRVFATPQQGTRVNPSREVPPYTFTKLPTTLMTSYYDYIDRQLQQSSLRVIPGCSKGGGYFMSYHGSRSSYRTIDVYILAPQ